MPFSLRARGCALNRGMVRASSPFRRTAVGTGRSGAVRGGDRWCVQAPLRGALARARRRDQPRRRATSSASGGFDRSRPTGSAVRRPCRQRAATERPPPGRPTRSQLVAAIELVRHEVQQFQRFDGEEAVRDAGRDRDALVGSSSRVSTRGAVCTPSSNGRRRRARRTRARGDDPVVDSWRWRPRSTPWRTSRGWPGRTARSRLRRHSSRKLPRSSACRSTAP